MTMVSNASVAHVMRWDPGGSKLSIKHKDGRLEPRSSEPSSGTSRGLIPQKDTEANIKDTDATQNDVGSKTRLASPRIFNRYEGLRLKDDEVETDSEGGLQDPPRT